MTRVAFLGPEGTFTSQAVSKAIPQADRTPLATIAEVISAVRDGEVDLGVVPMENSIEGSVFLTLDDLAFGPPGAFIRGEVTIPIAMNLLGKAGVSLADVTTVRSQPHALAQCRQWLARHLPDAEQQAATSTAEAAREAGSGDGSVAALGPAVAAERFGLEILAPDIHDHDGNTTRFVILGRSLTPATGADKTSLVVFFGEDRPGLLLRILDEFALRGINLTKIESRPTKQALGEYCIFLDCAGHVTEARVGEALRSVHRSAAEVRILGSYARADGHREPPEPADSDAAYDEAGEWHRRILDAIEGGR